MLNKYNKCKLTIPIAIKNSGFYLYPVIRKAVVEFPGNCNRKCNKKSIQLIYLVNKTINFYISTIHRQKL